MGGLQLPSSSVCVDCVLCSFRAHEVPDAFLKAFRKFHKICYQGINIINEQLVQLIG